MIAALGLSTFKCETVGISIFITSWGHLQNILAIFDTVARTEDSVIMTVSQNKVYGIRDQRPKKGWDKGSQARDLRSQAAGSESTVPQRDL